jgi:hypothetical protein
MDSNHTPVLSLQYRLRPAGFSIPADPHASGPVAAYEVDVYNTLVVNHAGLEPLHDEGGRPLAKLPISRPELPGTYMYGESPRDICYFVGGAVFRNISASVTIITDHLARYGPKCAPQFRWARQVQRLLAATLRSYAAH